MQMGGVGTAMSSHFGQKLFSSPRVLDRSYTERYPRHCVGVENKLDSPGGSISQLHR